MIPQILIDAINNRTDMGGMTADWCADALRLAANSLRSSELPPEFRDASTYLLPSDGEGWDWKQEIDTKGVVVGALAKQAKDSLPVHHVLDAAYQVVKLRGDPAQCASWLVVCSKFSAMARFRGLDPFTVMARESAGEGAALLRIADIASELSHGR